MASEEEKEGWRGSRNCSEGDEGKGDGEGDDADAADDDDAGDALLYLFAAGVAGAFPARAATELHAPVAETEGDAATTA